VSHTKDRFLYLVLDYKVIITMPANRNSGMQLDPVNSLLYKCLQTTAVSTLSSLTRTGTGQVDCTQVGASVYICINKTGRNTAAAHDNIAVYCKLYTLYTV